MKLIIILLLTIFSLNSCRSFERQVICKEIDSYKIKPSPMCDISFTFNRCRCRCFDYNKWETLPDIKQCKKLANAPITTVVKLKKSGEIEYQYQVADFALEFCDGIAGPFLSDIAVNIRPNIKALNEVKGKLCD